MTDTAEQARIEAEIGRTSKSSDPFAAAVRATRMPILVTDPSQPDNPVVFVNDAFCKMSGYARDDVLGRNCRFLQGPDTDRDTVSRLRDAIDRRTPIEVDVVNHRKDGSRFWNRVLVSPVFDDDGQLTYFFASQFDVTLERDRLVGLQRDRDALETEVERRTDDLSRSESRLRFIMEAARLGTWSLDLQTQRFLTSPLSKRIFGRSEVDPFSYHDFLAALFPADRQKVEEAITRCSAEPEDLDVEHRIRLPDGEVRWIQARGQASFGADGSPLIMAGIVIDISDRKRADDHRAMLSAELDHRVKNSMANIQSIANQTLRNATSLKEARETLSARLASLARAHDVLTGTSWGGATLDEIVTQALTPFRSGLGTRFKFGGPNVRLTPSLSLAFILALHELATNAVKYGALSNETGYVILNWDLDGDRLALRWEELDGPSVSVPERTGFGSKMIERALAMEGGGTAKIDYRPRGVVFSFEAALPAATDEGEVKA